MSNAVYPTLPGLDYSVHRAPIWHTDVRTTPSQREYRSTQQLYALRRRQLTYNILRSSTALAELQTLEGFFNAHAGRLRSFLFSDPDDSSVTDQLIGVGDGTTTDFQLARTWGGVVEPIAKPNGSITVKRNGVGQTAGVSYNLVAGPLFPSDASVVRFTAPPAAGQSITWSGSYYWRVRFDRDDLDFERVIARIWKTGRLDLYETRT